MTVGDYLDALEALPFGTVGDLTGGAPFLVLSPHPDDETLGCGGLLALAGRAGIEGHVMILTDGAASHRNSPSHPPERLTALRRDEAERAAAELGLPEDRLGFLALRDAATPSEGPAFDAAVDAIVARAEATDVRTLFVTWGRDPHCDHETAFAMARAAAARLGAALYAYPVWGLHLPRGDAFDEPDPRGYRLDIAEARDDKRRAIDRYPSQMTRMIDDDPDAFCFTAEQLAPFLGAVETFIEVRT
ncbi:PIG-L deacetylase family protein [Lichenibacterium dinghuense]|uniref:PIG-L deacetylase family protein n=1 Tax=Lichenibacterium dinghuense TaxID=2895977 RepID=UPI001F36B3EF|nr:PIG-L family deacetylase [Lichenibacterium sp. 6Y81]